MRPIDADELLEHAYRDKLDSRELIANMIRNAPTITAKHKAEFLQGFVYNVIARLLANVITDSVKDYHLGVNAGLAVAIRALIEVRDKIIEGDEKEIV